MSLHCVYTELGFRLQGDFRDVARSVDYLVIDLEEGWSTHRGAVGLCSGV